MPKVEVLPRGWNTIDQVQSRLVNMRLVNGVLVPRPKAQLWMEYENALSASEWIQGIKSHVLEESAGVLGTCVFLATNTGSNSRIWLKRFNLPLGATNVFMTDDASTSAENFTTMKKNTPDWISLGDKLYLNTGNQFFDLMGYTYPFKVFQCDIDSRIEIDDPNLDDQEIHEFLEIPLERYSGYDVGIASVAYSDPYTQVNYNAATFEFGYTFPLLDPIIDSIYTLPLGTFELAFFFKVSGWQSGASLSLELRDEDDNPVFGSKEHNRLFKDINSGADNHVCCFDLSNPTQVIRRSIYIDTEDLLNRKPRIDRLVFKGTGFSASGTFNFYLGDGAYGITTYASSFVPLVDDIKYLTYTIGSSSGLPLGSGIESDPRAFHVLSRWVPDRQILIDGFFLRGLLQWDSLSDLAKITYYMTGLDGKKRALPSTITRDEDSKQEVVSFLDLRDETITRTLPIKGYSFPHKEQGTTPTILSSCFWNGRLCLSLSTGELWISDPSDSFAFGESSDGEIVSLPRIAYQLIPTETSLFLVETDGIHILYGKPGSLIHKRKKKGIGRNNGFSEELLFLQNGVYDTNLNEVTKLLRSEIETNNIEYLEWGTTDRGYFGSVKDIGSSERFLWENFDGSWSKNTFESLTEIEYHTAAYFPGEGLVIAARDGLYKLDSPLKANDWEWTFDLKFPVNSRIVSIEVEGTGRCKVSVNNLTSTEVEIDIPGVVYSDLFDPAAQTKKASITLSGSGVEFSDQTRIERLIVHWEPIEALEGGLVN